MSENQTQGTQQAQSVQVTPELLQQIKAAGYVVRNSQEDSEFLENFGKDKANRVTSELWNGIDADLKNLTGLEKLQNEKTYDYLKRSLQTIQNAEKSAKEQAKKLESDIRDGKIDSIFKEKFESLVPQLDAAKTLLSKKEQEFEQKINEIHESYFMQSVSKDVNSAIKEMISFIPDESTQELLEIGLFDFFNKNVKVTRVMNEKGEMEIVYSDKKTGEQFKSKETYAPLKLQEILMLNKSANTIIAKELSKKPTQTGTGSGRQGTTNNKPQANIVVDPNMTRAVLMDALLKTHKAGSSELIQAYSEYAKKYQESFGKQMQER